MKDRESIAKAKEHLMSKGYSFDNYKDTAGCIYLENDLKDNEKYTKQRNEFNESLKKI